MRRTAPLLALAATGLSLLVALPAGATAEPATTRVVVLMQSGAGSARGALQAASVRGDVVADLPALSGYVADVPAGALAELRSDPAVAAVEVDGRVRGLDTAPPTRVDPPYGVDRLDQRAGASGSYRPPGTGAGVTAYVLDSGISTTHRDLGGRAVSVRDYVNPAGDGEDCNGHGTHVAGTLGGQTYGVAAGVRLRSVRVLDCRNEGYVSSFLRGLDYVVGAHAAGTPAVVNLSLSSLQPSAVIDAAVKRVVADGVTVVAAAGNDDRDACASSPARVPEVLTVGAVGERDRRASFSNSGSCVDLFAPGVQVRSASWLDDTGSELRDGTSQAAPHVAGAAALLLQADPRATPAQVAARLAAAATKGVVADARSARADLLFVGGGAPPPPPPGNDAFAAARPLQGDRGSDATYLTGATAQPGEPAHAPGNPAVHSVWWTWTADRDGTLALNVVGDDVDTVLAAYTGSAVGDLVKVAANDDGSRTTHASALALPVRAGSTYRIALDGFAGETGQVVLAHRFTTGAPDLAAPRVTAVSLNPTTAPAGTGPVVVTVGLRLTDELGARDPVVDLRDEGGRSAGAARARRVQGTAQDGLWRATVLVPQETRPGTYRVRTYPTRDVVGNTASEPGPPTGLAAAVTVTAGRDARAAGPAAAADAHPLDAAHRRADRAGDHPGPAVPPGHADPAARHPAAHAGPPRHGGRAAGARPRRGPGQRRHRRAAQPHRHELRGRRLPLRLPRRQRPPDLLQPELRRRAGGRQPRRGPARQRRPGQHRQQRGQPVRPGGRGRLVRPGVGRAALQRRPPGPAARHPAVQPGAPRHRRRGPGHRPGRRPGRRPRRGGRPDRDGLPCRRLPHRLADRGGPPRHQHPQPPGRPAVVQPRRRPGRPRWPDQRVEQRRQPVRRGRRRRLVRHDGQHVPGAHAGAHRRQPAAHTGRAGHQLPHPGAGPRRRPGVRRHGGRPERHGDRRGGRRLPHRLPRPARPGRRRAAWTTGAARSSPRRSGRRSAATAASAPSAAAAGRTSSRTSSAGTAPSRAPCAGSGGPSPARTSA